MAKNYRNCAKNGQECRNSPPYRKTRSGNAYNSILEFANFVLDAIMEIKFLINLGRHKEKVAEGLSIRL